MVVRQISDVAYRSDGFALPHLFFELDAVLVVHPDGRKPGFVAFELLIVQRVVSQKSLYVRRIYHDVNHADIFADHLRLIAVFLVRLSGKIHFLQVFLVEDDFHSFFCHVGAKIVQNLEKSTIYEDFFFDKFPVSQSVKERANLGNVRQACLNGMAEAQPILLKGNEAI